MIAAMYFGGAAHLQKLKLGAAQADPGIIMIGGAGTSVGVIPTTTTLASTVPAYGLGIDRGIYSTTQGDAEGLVTVDTNPNLVIKALMSGGATEGTTLQRLINTLASAGGTVVTDTDVLAADMDGGLLVCIAGNNVGLSRSITSMTASTSATVTVPFPRAIAVNDEFFMIPYNFAGTGAAGADGPGWVQTTTLFTQADASIASGAGVVASVVDLELNGLTDSWVIFILRSHTHNSDSQAA